MGKKQKIILTATSDLCTDQRMQRICGSLHLEGYQVKLVGRYLGKKASFDFESKQINCLFNAGFLFYAEYNIRLVFYLLFQKSDAICSVDLDTILSGRIVTKIKSSKHIYDAHEYYTESPEIDDRPRVKAFWEWVARKSVPKIHLGYTVNKSIADRLSERYGPSFSVIRNLPLQNDTYQESNQDVLVEPFLFYQGVLNKGRGLEQLIMAMQEIDGLKLKIAGKGDLDQMLRKLVKENKLESKIEFLGILDPKEVRRLSHLALLGFNLLDGANKNYYYSLANKFFDYMMTGLPSISMDFPEYRLINEHHNFSILIKDIEPSTISKTVNKLMADEDQLKTLKQNALKAQGLLNWQEEQKALLQLYAELFAIP